MNLEQSVAPHPQINSKVVKDLILGIKVVKKSYRKTRQNTL